MINGLPSEETYSFTIEKVGLLTLSSTPRSSQITYIKVVFQTPMSP